MGDPRFMGLAKWPTREDLAVGLRPGQQPHARISDFLPRRAWWKLYINPEDHQDAMKEAMKGEDPGRLYDLQGTVGYQQSMLRAYDEILDNPYANKLVDVLAYENMHRLVTGELASGRPKLNAGYGFHSLHSHTVAPDALNEVIAGKTLLGVFQNSQLFTFDSRRVAVPDAKEFDRMEETTLVAVCIEEDQPIHVQLVFDAEERRGMVSAVLTRYHSEVAAAGSEEGKLGAIAKAIRALHVIHAFNDANGRLNISLLLQKFLLDQGFAPAILPEMTRLFSGGRTIDEIAEKLVDAGVTRSAWQSDRL